MGLSKENNTCPLCGKRYSQDYQFGLHCWASEKGFLPDCGRGTERRVYDSDSEAAQ